MSNTDRWSGHAPDLVRDNKAMHEEIGRLETLLETFRGVLRKAGIEFDETDDGIMWRRDEVSDLASKLGSVASDVDAIEIAAKLAMREIELGEDPRTYLLKIIERCDELAERLGDKL